APNFTSVAPLWTADHQEVILFGTYLPLSEPNAATRGFNNVVVVPLTGGPIPVLHTPPPGRSLEVENWNPVTARLVLRDGVPARDGQEMSYTRFTYQRLTLGQWREVGATEEPRLEIAVKQGLNEPPAL